MTQIKVKSMLGKMVSDNLLTLYKERYQLTNKEYTKIVEYRKRQTKKGVVNKDEIFPRLAKIRGTLLKNEQEDEVPKKGAVQATKKNKRVNKIEISQEAIDLFNGVRVADEGTKPKAIPGVV